MESHFTEQQVSEIIRKAAEHQSRSDTPGPAPAGMSESEVRRVAKELGIDEDALAHAISEVGSSTLSDTGTIASFERTLERVIDGDLPEESLALVIEEFVPVPGMQGSTVNIGRAINYTCMAGLGQCNVNVSPRNGKTVLRVKSQAFLAMLPAFIPAFVVSLIGLGLIGKGLDAGMTVGSKFLFAALLLGGVWGIAFLAFRAMVRYTNRRVLELTDRTASKLGEAAVHLRERLEQGPVHQEEVGQDLHL